MQLITLLTLSISYTGNLHLSFFLLVYKVRLVTSSDEGSGTNESVYIRIFGDKGVTSDSLFINLGSPKFQTGRLVYLY